LLNVGTWGYRHGALTTNVKPHEPRVIYPGHGFDDDLSLAMGIPTSMSVQLRKLFLFSGSIGVQVNVEK
jgi:hypothetical protein